jgi:hypothetical protein
MRAAGLGLPTALLLLAGCATGGQHVPEPGPTPVALSPAQQVLVYRRGEVVRWHAVVVSRDSITGIPYKMPTACADCRRALPRTEVDSLRIRDGVGATRVLAGVAILALVAGDVWMMAQPDHPQP